MTPTGNFDFNTYANTENGQQGGVFGSQSQEDLNELQKALEAGDLTGQATVNSTTASGAPLKVESLDANLKILTHRQQDIRLFKAIPKSKAYNTVEEFNQLDSYGEDRGGFNREGELPEEEDSTYVRRSQLVKFLGVTKSVTHPMTMVNTNIGNIITREIQNGTLWILRKLNRSLVFGDETIIPEEFNGLYKQHKTDSYSTVNAYLNDEVVIDLRGRSLLEGDLENGAETIVENFGLGTDFFAPPKVLSKFVQNFYQNKFINLKAGEVSNATVGQSVNYFESQYGRINLNYDIFMKGMKGRVPKLISSGATSSKSPAAPTPDSVTPVAAVAAATIKDGSSRFASGDAGNYFYAISAINRHGESALALLSASAVEVVANGGVDLKFAATGGPYSTTGFVVYRSEKGAAGTTGKFSPLFEISTSQLAAGYEGAAVGSLREKNQWLPDTDQAFMIQNDTQVHEFKQLAPLMKMDLAVLSPAFRFMILMYGTPLLYAPKRMVRYINIGK